MSDPVFFHRAGNFDLSTICALLSIDLPEGVDGGLAVTGVAPLDRAGSGDISFCDNPRYLTVLGETRAVAVLVAAKHAARVASGVVPLVVPEPYRAFAQVLAAMYPAAIRPGLVFEGAGVAPGSFVHPEARLESGVRIDPGAVVGPRAEIGSGTVVAAHAVIGPDVRIGRDCAIGPGATVQHSLIGNRVIIHPGVRIGQDGFGFAMGPRGHLKVPQVGRVIVQDDVEIGANTTIDRGANRDTVIGEGTKIDNLVQIGHNVVIGRHCVIVAQVGISGSTTLEDFVVIGGQVGMVGHITLGQGAQIAASSNVASDVPAGARWGGTPAKPVRDWFRELTLVSQLAKRKSETGSGDAGA
jgi:UDP-3-O-[3-hydroxymyristoyl] glucosamine N-acyltransferase